MKAIVSHAYGTDGLRCDEIEKPAPGAGEVLVEVRAASVNPLDWYLMRGKPYVARAFTGLRRPKTSRPGRDLAGRVTVVGGNVTRFRPGDDVFGASAGSFSEYVVATEGRLAPKPAGITFEQAAAAPVAGLTALQALRDKGGVRPGHKVLINGASGGVGTFAVQIAKTLGAEVTGVCSPGNVEIVRSIGADHVIDYTREDFARTDRKYDVILDNYFNHPLSAYRRILAPEGKHILVGGPPARILRALGAIAWSRLVKRGVVNFLAKLDVADLVTLGALMESGKVKPVIDRRYTLAQAAQAMAYLGEGHARGKVIITIGAPAASSGNSAPL